ncbi:MAG: hypothetical protein WAX14_21460 [Rhodococcus sp. (in: high G+C Gram-positive bacteria)]|uniref:hypothetical protein n=1 Tax=Rhodococcus sp. TaxID=1831 RepID=UPI003BB6EBCC
MTRRPAAVLLCVAVAVALSACTVHRGNIVDENLTQAEALHRTVGYLEDLVGALPDGTSLTQNYSRNSTGKIGTGHVGPCYDGNLIEDMPANVGARYQVSGMPGGAAKRYLGLIVDYWESRDWPVDERMIGDTLWAGAQVPDGFGFSASVNDSGDLSVTVSSTCFPHVDSGYFGTIDTPETIGGSG